MNEQALFPFELDADWLQRYCKLPLHSGVGRVDQHGNPNHPLAEMSRLIRKGTGQTDPISNEFVVSFLVPATGNLRIFLKWPNGEGLNLNHGEGLSVSGQGSDGPFRLHCPHYRNLKTSRGGERPAWAIAGPKGLATLTYGESRPVARVTAIINNFDFEYGNVSVNPAAGCVRETLQVEAAGRAVRFKWSEHRTVLRRLIEADLMRTASLVGFDFDAWPGASPEELKQFALDLSSFCQYVAGQHTGIPVISFLDNEGAPIYRLLGEAVLSDFHPTSSFPYGDEGLPRFFRECFEEHVKIQRTDLWKRMPYLYAAIEDPPYIEQRYATLMMAIELLIRNSLIEGGHNVPNNLPQLIGAARGSLRWNVPNHYTENERYRVARNAVDHGDQLPHDPIQLRHDLDKWRLFLFRRMLIRMRYTGEIESPRQGWASSSRVDEFSEEHNSFRR